MIKYKVGDVLNQTYDGPVLICHIIGNSNAFGAGMAAAVARKYPEVKRAYDSWYDDTIFPCDIRNADVPFMLGEIQPIQVSDNVYVVNMLAQSRAGGSTFYIGREKVWLRPIRLDSLRECLYNVAVLAKQMNAKVVGNMFGSALAGGQWDSEIAPIVEDCLCRFGIDVTIYSLT